MDQEERERILSRWTLQEKIRLLQGDTPHSAPGNGDFYPGLTLMDGPNGLRKAEEGGNSLGGIADTGRTTCFPCPTLLASTWDRDVLREVGKAIGRECLFFRVQVLLGPALNIQRHPLCGRNFEYYSEDPLLSGEQAASFVQGVQEVSVGTTVKHLCCNNNEEMRFVGDSLVDERALREIYLRPFEIAIKKGRPTCVMNAYNRVNGVPASSSPLLNDEILRQEWGFDGLVMTDWGGIVDRVEALKAGTDLEMPGQCVHNERLLMQAVKEGKISESLIDQSVIRLLSTAEKTKPSADVSKNIFEENEQLAIDAATQGAVLLKNDGILPLSRDQRILAVGPFFENPRYQGSGSSLLNPFRLTTHRQAFERRNLRFSYAEGFDAYREEVDDKKEKEALRKAESADVVLFYGGQNDWFESEGFDRTSLSLPRNQLSLLEKLVERGKKVVFLLFTGSPVALPFRDKVAAIPVGVPPKIDHPTQLDQLWTEFFTTGKVEPIRRLVGALTPSGATMTIEEFKARKERGVSEPEDRQKLMNHLIRMAAEWSLGSNAQQHRLVAYYLEAMLARREIKDPQAADQVRQILRKAKLSGPAPSFSISNSGESISKTPPRSDGTP